jgi:hypothetical protein
LLAIEHDRHDQWLFYKLPAEHYRAPAPVRRRASVRVGYRMIMLIMFLML